MSILGTSSVKPAWLAVLLGSLAAAGLLLGAGAGSTGWQALSQAWSDDAAWQIVREIRLPRSVGAWLAGARGKASRCS